MNKTRMKMQCTAKTVNAQGDTLITLSALYEGDGGENRVFAAATPSATLSALISKGKPAADNFEQGADYYIDIALVADVKAAEGGEAMSLDEIKAGAGRSWQDPRNE